MCYLILIDNILHYLSITVTSILKHREFTNLRGTFLFIVLNNWSWAVVEKKMSFTFKIYESTLFITFVFYSVLLTELIFDSNIWYYRIDWYSARFVDSTKLAIVWKLKTPIRLDTPIRFYRLYLDMYLRSSIVLCSIDCKRRKNITQCINTVYNE